ncbi:pilus assembly PilX family protein [Marinobacterium stanieri]|uniref:Type IV pilus assembly protein PilX n=1 Tax=Marinobacterium stanieri TaxID=49186 RepID=A0A1N6SCX6_9GAMM|nr:PilX N-terminal domain-containing pilus assembly protein [Marinobacterium stanieri]SIQ38978.1 type IV pilus assembly protein PilX [Marinobacterium stanieri]
MNNRSIRCQKHQGSALVVAMIMLVLIGIIGVGSMQTTTMEEKMSGNTRDKNISFQAAEAGLRNREAWLQAQLSPPAPNDDWIFDDDIDWDAPFIYGTDNDTDDLTNVNAQPQMVIEEMEFIPDDLVTGYDIRKGRDIYRVMSQGTGQSPNSITTLESTFAKRFN